MGLDFNDCAIADPEALAPSMHEAYAEAESNMVRRLAVHSMSGEGSSPRAEVSSDTDLDKLLGLRRTICPSQGKPVELIAGLFPRGGLTIIGSKPGSYKSFLLQRIVSDLSIGGAVLDGYAVQPKPLASIILAGEAGADMLDTRSTWVDWKFNADLINVFDDLECEHAGLSLELGSESGRRRISELVSAVKPDVLFIDSLVAFNSSDESDSKPMRVIIKFLNDLAKNYSIAVVAMHHHTKTNRNNRNTRADMDDLIGSSILIRYAAATYSIEDVTSDQVDGEQWRRLRCTKCRWRMPKPFAFRLANPFNDDRCVMEINTDIQESLPAKDEVLLHIKGTYAPGESFKRADILPHVACGDTSLKNSIAGLVELKVLRQVGSARNTEYVVL